MTSEEFKVFSESPEGVAMIRPLIDRAVTTAVKTTEKRIPTFERSAERLQAIEAAADKKIASLQLENYAIKKCHSLGLSLDAVMDLGVSFSDSKDADIKLEKIAHTFKKNEMDNLNREMANSYKPGMGNPRPYRPGLDSYSQIELEAFEKNGMLDKMMKEL